jgi:hypothetical protein
MPGPDRGCPVTPKLMPLVRISHIPLPKPIPSFFQDGTPPSAADPSARRAPHPAWKEKKEIHKKFI